jgi:hypothetical protein
VVTGFRLSLAGQDPARSAGMEVAGPGGMTAGQYTGRVRQRA